MRVIPVSREVELRPLTPADADALYKSIDRNRERLRQWLPWARPGYSIEDARIFLEEIEKLNAAGGSLTSGIWVSGILRGTIGLHKIDLLNRNTSIGYWLDGEVEGRGIMTKSCRSMISEGFLNYSLHRIEIRCATGNERSCAIPKRLGFREEGLLKEAEWLFDRWVDLRLFAILKTDWVS